MPKRSSSDLNQTAFRIVQQSTGHVPPPVQTLGLDPVSDKNPAAVALGRLGGLKGGKARAKSLSAAKRSEIAKKAAKRRWENHKRKPSSSGL